MVFFDMLWYDVPAYTGLLFFELSDTDHDHDHFTYNIVPQLKDSLSLTLSHFLPLAGNIIHPTTHEDHNNNNNNNIKTSKKPILRYAPGDSVSFTIAVSHDQSNNVTKYNNTNNNNFNHLVGNHPRVCEDFYAFAPYLPPATHSEYSIACPVLALQATLLVPAAGMTKGGRAGLCIGFAAHHGIADASTVVSFLQAWSLTNRAKMITSPNCRLSLPFYDREAITNLNGLDTIYWDQIVESCCAVEPPPVRFPTNNLRATFTITKEEIQKLKNYLLLIMMSPSNSAGGGGGLAHLSSFTVINALVWVCRATTSALLDQDVADDEFEYFRFTADCRGRLSSPPLPSNYFGNCVKIVKVKLKHEELIKGRYGFVMAAKAIGDAIKENVMYNDDDKGILYGAENWLKECLDMKGKRQCGVWGSPRFDFYEVDYGWGKPNKFEALSIDAGGAISLCKSKQFQGGLEFGLSMPKVYMDVFASVFTELLTELLHHSS